MSKVPFDTEAAVNELKAAGFTGLQAQALTRVIRNALGAAPEAVLAETCFEPRENSVLSVEWINAVQSDLIGSILEGRTR